MDGDRFDRLARLVGAGRTRRVLFTALAALAPAGPTILDANAKKKRKHRHKKKKCKPKCGACEVCHKKKCKPAPDGARCGGGLCRGGVCFGGGGGNCTVSDGNELTSVTEGRFEGQALRATQTMPPFGPAGSITSHLDLTLGQASLLSIATETAGPRVTVTLTYGQAFSGINHAQFTNDGETVSGTIDGRAIAPFPANGDPGAATFEDGSPLPDAQVDPPLAQAVEQLLKESGHVAEGCAQARQGKRHPSFVQSGQGRHGSHRARTSGRGRSRAATRHGKDARAHPDQSPECLALMVPCQTGYIGCVETRAAGCNISSFGYGACVASALAACQYDALLCRKDVLYGVTWPGSGQICCPVPCGGDDPQDVFGEDPLCCGSFEECLDPHSNQTTCCTGGGYSCHGVQCCRSDETCLPGGACCRDDQPICGDYCCGQFDSCCGGECCTGICNGDSCCAVGSTPCGDGCCSNGNVCCNGQCCAASQSCVSGTCTTACDPLTQHACPADGSPNCCFLGTGCCPNGECCGQGTTCCSRGGVYRCSPTGCLG